MKIIKIGLYRFNRHFRLGFHSSHTLRTRAESVIVRLDFENKVSGFGESSPRTYVTGEDSSGVVETIKGRFAPLFFSQDFRTKEDVQTVLDAAEEECLGGNTSPYNSALGAMDVALLDALGKLHELPATHFLGTTTGETPPHSISVPILPLKRIEELFFHFREPKFKHVKVLVGEDERENLERVSLVRSLFGDHIHMRVDANGKWTFQQALSNLKRLEKFGITAVEQPLPKDDIDGLRQLKAETGISVIADESMCSLSDARNLIERQACDVLNIKISKCGGLMRSKRIARFAQSRNIPCQLGSHVGETDILTAAARVFALTTPNLMCWENSSSLLFEDPRGNISTNMRRRTNRDSTEFGLGILSLNEQAIVKRCVPILQITSKGMVAQEKSEN